MVAEKGKKLDQLNEKSFSKSVLKSYKNFYQTKQASLNNILKTNH